MATQNFATMVGMSRPARPLPITQQMLSLRRMAEAEAQTQLHAAKAELERAKLSEQQAAQRRQQFAHSLSVEEQIARATRTTTVADLSMQSQRLTALRDQLRDAASDEAEQAQQISELRKRLEEIKRHLRLCVARREAAELHEAAERREMRRQRERRERAIEEDARDRVLSATRPSRRT